jgi:hypothetical protein
MIVDDQYFHGASHGARDGPLAREGQLYSRRMGEETVTYDSV